jgi:hypothetical protein
VIRAGGGSDVNSSPQKSVIKAGGRKALVLPVFTALATGSIAGSDHVDSGAFNVSKGELLLAATFASNFDNTAATISIGLTGMVLVASVGGVTLWQFKADYTRIGAIVTAAFQSIADGAIVVSKINGVLGTLKAIASTMNGVTTAPDSGLATLFSGLPQCHYGVIGTVGANTDTVGAWQNGMTAGNHIGTAAVSAYIKEAARPLLTPAQARAFVTGQTSRDSTSLVVCYA